MQFTQSLAAWHTPEFISVFVNEIKQLDPDLLPLQQGLAHSSSANATNLGITILRAIELPEMLQIKAGLFYTGTIAGCSCADDPSPQNEVNEYCEVRVDIDKQTAHASITLLVD